ncbi:MAG: N-acetylmuramoyl-L-alanine amidase [Ruminococcaceae bacterium]|nr:N-acetylmuramoyl-L-alanine amidase [Oscillospiraceae bacterium]
MAVKIYIDQGHNPVNPNAGAEGNGYREQDLVYEIGQRLSEILRANGLETRLSRPFPDTQLGTSTATSLAARVNDANTWGADYFVSLHTNASVSSTATGSEAYVFRTGTAASALAESILRQLQFATGLPNRGVFARPTLYVLRRTRMPAVLVELGFISNPYDSSLMAEQPALFANGIANGILAYLGLL